MPGACSDGKSSDAKGNSASGKGSCASDGYLGSGCGGVVGGCVSEGSDTNAVSLDLISVSGATIVASECGRDVG